MRSYIFVLWNPIGTHGIVLKRKEEDVLGLQKGKTIIFFFLGLFSWLTSLLNREINKDSLERMHFARRCEGKWREREWDWKKWKLSKNRSFPHIIYSTAWVAIDSPHFLWLWHGKKQGWNFSHEYPIPSFFSCSHKTEIVTAKKSIIVRLFACHVPCI